MLKEHGVQHWEQQAKGNGNKELKKSRLGQDGRVGRLWAHLLPRAHQNYHYLQSNYKWEQSEG